VLINLFLNKKNLCTLLQNEIIDGRSFVYQIKLQLSIKSKIAKLMQKFFYDVK